MWMFDKDADLIFPVCDGEEGASFAKACEDAILHYASLIRAYATLITDITRDTETQAKARFGVA